MSAATTRLSAKIKVLFADLTYKSRQRLLGVPRLYVASISGTILLSISATRTTLSSSSLPKIISPPRVTSPVACMLPETCVLDPNTVFLVGLISRSLSSNKEKISLLSKRTLSVFSADTLMNSAASRNNLSISVEILLTLSKLILDASIVLSTIKLMVLTAVSMFNSLLGLSVFMPIRSSVTSKYSKSVSNARSIPSLIKLLCNNGPLIRPIPFDIILIFIYHNHILHI